MTTRSGADGTMTSLDVRAGLVEALKLVSLPETPSAWERTPDGATRGVVTRIREPLPRGAGHVRDDRRPIWTHQDGPRRLAASGRGRRERRSGGATFVVVMQTAEVRNVHHHAAGRRLHSP